MRDLDFKKAKLRKPDRISARNEADLAWIAHMPLANELGPNSLKELLSNVLPADFIKWREILAD
jgi:hypothetical protein